MLSRREAYLFGYTQASLAVYFEGATLVALQTADRTTLLGARIAQRLAKLQTQQSVMRTDIEHITERMAHLGLEAPPPPRFPGAYPIWTKLVFERVQSALGDEPAADAAYLLGGIAGEAWSTLTLGGLVLYLLDAAPEEPRLVAKAQELARAQERVLTQLEQAVAHPIWTEIERARITALRQTVASCPSLDVTLQAEVGPGERLSAVSDAAGRLEAELRALESALAAS